MPYGYTTDTQRRLTAIDDGDYGHEGAVGARLRVFAEDAINAAATAQTPSATKDSAPPGYGAHPNEVYLAPTNTWGARIKAAYWLAIASRLGYPNLNAKAVAYRNQFDSDKTTGAFGFLKSNFSESSGDINGILQKAAADIDAAGGRTDPRLTGIYRVFGVAQDTSRQSLTRDVRAEGSAAQVPQKVGEDITDAALFFRGLVTGERPPGMSETEWFWKKWGTRFGIGALATGALLIVGRPYISLVQSFFDKDKDEAPAPRANKKRRKKRA